MAGGVGRLPDVPVDLLVVGVVAVAEVEPGDVHAGVDQRAELLEGDEVRGRGCRRSWLDACVNLAVL